MNSMTGFGSARRSASSGLEVSVEISSLNKRQLDVRISLPPEMASFELPLRKAVAARLHRGTVVVRFSIEEPGVGGPVSSVVVDESLAASYASEARRLRDSLGLTGDVGLDWILSAPGVLVDRVSATDFDLDELMTPLEKALGALLRSRAAEGAELERDLRARLSRLSELIDAIEPKTVDVPKSQLARLERNLSAADLEFDLSDERVLKELVIFSDRSDVSEELTRIRGHLSAFASRFSDDGAIGKALEFLVQELQREIGTLGVKAAGLAISPLVMDFKTELEKIREQVQNVE
jgi:uncharacterized protein (TIGR00255 family)